MQRPGSALHIHYSPVRTRHNRPSRGLLAGAVIFILYAAVYFPDTSLNRPHPVFWRVVQGASCFYLLFVIFMLFIVLFPHYHRTSTPDGK